VHLLLLQQCAAVWGNCAIGKRKSAAQAAHLGDQSDGGFFVFVESHRVPWLGIKYRTEAWRTPVKWRMATKARA